MVKVRIDTSVSGPFFSQSGKIMREASREWVRDMVREGEAKYEAQLYAGHGVATGKYKSSIGEKVFSDYQGAITRTGGGRSEKQQAIIGNWLEGSKSRNEKHRFKGYGMRRKTRMHLTRLTREMAGKVYRRATKRLTGGIA